MKLIDVQRVWDRGEHNAFTDLCFYKERFWLVFREARDHYSEDGVVVVLCSDDGKQWQLAAEIRLQAVDLRDPKIVVTPDNQLLLTVAGPDYVNNGALRNFLSWSVDGEKWSSLKHVGADDCWIWRTRFINNVGYGVAYDYRGQSDVTALYRLDENNDYQCYVDNFFVGNYPNEHDICLLDDGTLLCLLRRDGEHNHAQLGLSAPPYIEWRWQDLGCRIGGPVILPLRDGRLLAALRLHDPERTSLCWLQLVDGQYQLEEAMILPSAGDTSYPGLVQQENIIYCSYYSSHEEKTAIYVAQLTL